MASASGSRATSARRSDRKKRVTSATTDWLMAELAISLWVTLTVSVSSLGRGGLPRNAPFGIESFS